MSCENCNKFQDGEMEKGSVVMPKVVRVLKNGKLGPAYFRWKNANIELNGCDEHLREVFDALNEAQSNDKQNKP